MKSRPWIIAFALALPALGACGGAEALDPGAAESLQQQVRELAVVTQDGNLELAVDRAESLKDEVQQAEASGAVTPGRAGRIQQNIDAFIESVQPVEEPAPAAPAAPSSKEPAPSTQTPSNTVPSTTPNRRRDIEDSGTPAERQQEASEEAAEEAQEFAEKQEKERQKREEDRED
ncbi:hypothetical protein [uncultured Arthrobacter sp.]|uniref:hypothetical protein n=1 Tax=uncultured Arthrobacter sp. TaxID=114050 RepID=UPI002609BD39|nr:hypothetical protein [uncultured Arthrobacter sp.]